MGSSFISLVKLPVDDACDEAFAVKTICLHTSVMVWLLEMQRRNQRQTVNQISIIDKTMFDESTVKTLDRKSVV